MPPVPRILVWNKIDLWGDQPLPQVDDPEQYAAEVAVSATHRHRAWIACSKPSKRRWRQALYTVTLKLPYERGELVSQLHELGSVQEQTHTEDGIVLTVQLPHALYERFKEYRV